MIPTLAEMSLSVLIRKFEQICAGLNIETCVPWMHKEFIKRCYSEEIFNALKNKGELKEEYLGILINRHIKGLNIQDVHSSLLPHVIDKLQGNGEGVLSLKAGFNDTEEISCDLLMSALPNLRSISFNGYIHPEFCEAVGKNCSHLQVLEIYNDDEEDYSWFYEKEEEDEDPIRFIIESCPHLETLRLSDSVGLLYTMHTRGKLNKYGTLSLKSLSSRSEDYPLDHALEVCITLCPYVSDLELDCLGSDIEVEKILSFRFLSNLKINSISNITANCFENFLKLSGSELRSLDMPYASCFSVANLIEYCPKLQSLKLRAGANRAASQTHRAQSCTSSLADLKTLHFFSFSFNNPSAVHDLRLLLLAAKKLRSLSLNRCSGLTSNFIRSLNLKHIYELDVGWSDIETNTLEELATCGSLQRLTVEGCWKVHKSPWKFN